MNQVVALRKQESPETAVSLLRIDTVPEAITKLEEAKERMEEIDRELAHMLGIPDTKPENFLTRLALYISKEKHRYLGGKDPLDVLEENMRGVINDTQSALMLLASTAKNKRQELREMEADLVLARDENWDAAKIQEYIAKKTKMALPEEVKELLLDEFAILPQNEIGAQKTALLAQIESNIHIGERLMGVLSATCCAGLEVFHHGQRQYYDYMCTYREVRAIRNAAKTLVAVDDSLALSRAAVVETYRASIEAIGCALDAARQIEHYAIGSDETILAITDGREKLEARLRGLKDASSAPELPAPQEKAKEIPASA